MRQANGVVATLVIVLAAVVTGFGLYVLTRVASSVVAGEIRAGSATALTLTALTALALGGIALLASPRTRFGGALVMIAPGIGLVHLGLYQLYSLSATVGTLMFGMPRSGGGQKNECTHPEPLLYPSPLETPRDHCKPTKVHPR
jgi:hypothetical protein